MTTITPRTRLLRGVSAAVVITLLAVASHETGGGEVSVLAGLLALTVSALTCVVLAGTVLTPLRSSAAVLVGQGLYHVLFAAFPASPDGATTGAVLASHHGEGQIPVSSGRVEVNLLAPGVQHLDVHSDLMWIAHVLAAATALVVVLRGEESWWQLVRALTLLLRRLMLQVVVFLGHSAPVEAPPSAHVPILTSVRFVTRAPTRRGPPVGSSTPIH